MSSSLTSSHLAAALRRILEELESDPEAQAQQPELHNLKLQLLATLADMELRQQSAAATPIPPAPPRAAAAALAELLRGELPASQPTALEAELPSLKDSN